METLDIEVVLKRSSMKFLKDVINVCMAYLHHCKNLKPGDILSKFDKNTQIYLYDNVEYIIIGQHNKLKNAVIDLNQVEPSWYVFTLDDNGPQLEKSEDQSGDCVTLSTHYILPSRCIFGMWENLIYDANIKEHLLKYAQTMMLFSEKGVNHNVVSCNRVILLHGPPGTGKTSLCKALAHKLSIKMQDMYKRAVLLEINSHSLFSKWFSESGKLVTKMFSKIIEILEDSDTLVCVLMDEVESLAHARDKCMSGNEPSDSMRVVNALLTEIDQLKRYPNVLILTTSNLTASIDIAFVDRADIKQFIGLPSTEAIYQIYYSCIQELVKTEIIFPRENLQPQADLQTLKCEDVEDSDIYHNSKKLVNLCDKSSGFSGRTLRKIPFLAHALFVEGTQTTLNKYFEAMGKAIEYEKRERNHFQDLVKMSNGF